MTRVYILIFLFALCKISVSQNTSNIPIVPTPQVIEIGNGDFIIDKDISITISGKDAERNLFAAQEIQRTLKEIFGLNITINNSNPKSKQIILEETDSSKLFNNKYKDLNRDGYYLLIDKENITIKAFSPIGIFYGSVSLIQMLEKAVNNKLPVADIIDWPDLRMRGISDDISRGQVSTMDNFKKIIREMARYKMNTYMPYLEDMLKFDAFPTIGVGRGALSKSEVKELVEYAGKYFIEVIPIFQTLGHYENILSQDEFIKYAEYPGAASLNVSSDSTYAFLESMLKEVFQMFPSQYFHMGADESYDVGLGKSKQLVEKNNRSVRDTNIKKKSDSKANEGIAIVHAKHYNLVYNICKKYNKRVMMYSDIVLQYPKIMDLIPKDIIMVDWHYNPTNDYNSTKKFKDAGLKFIVSPSVWNFTSGFPLNSYALPNIKNITEAGIEQGSIGMINSNWGDYGSETFKELLYFDYAWSAQCAWNLKSSDVYSFSRNYFYDFFGVDDPLNTQVYQTLSEPYNLVNWNEFWWHPLLPFRDLSSYVGNINITVRLNWMDWTLPLASNNIDKLKAEATKNKDHYELLKYIVRINEFFNNKEKTMLLLHEKLNREVVNITMLQSMIDTNISELAKLRDDYKKLWLLYYKQDNLDLITDKFNRLIGYFREIKENVIKDKLQSPIIKSDWIYLKTSKSDFAAKAIFKRDFLLESKPDSALLQLIGDTYAKLYINGQYVDQVYAKRTLSLRTEYKRIKLIDITKYLKDSINTIEVQCENFNPKDKAGCNIYSEIYLKDKTKGLITDDNWYAKLPGSEKWHKAIAQKYSKPVIAPDFKTKRTSWIER